ncbi:unnamed protein product [Citrullus colocynthis]|uniref:Uncharacterized protein n=1 Tax=Citrullus colocynthis TaxID=252529 RepID=A0ABP0Y1K0_9ROSI
MIDEKFSCLFFLFSKNHLAAQSLTFKFVLSLKKKVKFILIDGFLNGPCFDVVSANRKREKANKEFAAKETKKKKKKSKEQKRFSLIFTSGFRTRPLLVRILGFYAEL